MKKVYDFTLKYLLEKFPEDFLKHLLGLEYSKMPEFLDTELKYRTRIADVAIKLESAIVHIEFQHKFTQNVPCRMLEYSVRLENKYKLPVISYLIVLTKPVKKYIPVPDKYEWKGLKGENILSFNYKVINLWELKREEWENYKGLIPLLPLMKGDEDVEKSMKKYEEKIDQLTMNKEEKADIATCLAMISSVKYGIEINNLWRRIMVVSPLFKEILKEGKEEGLKEGSKKEKIEIAKKMLLKGMAISDIVALTGLSKEEIKNLKKK